MTMLELETVEYPEMQAAHEHEAALLQQLAEQISAHSQGTDNTAELDATLAAFVSSMESHFTMEDDLMRRLGFPPYPAHAGEHQEVLHGVRQTIAAWRQGHDDDRLRRHLLDEHVRWMTRHVATMDHLTARFINMALAAGRGNQAT